MSDQEPISEQIKLFIDDVEVRHFTPNTKVSEVVLLLLEGDEGFLFLGDAEEPLALDIELCEIGIEKHDVGISRLLSITAVKRLTLIASPQLLRSKRCAIGRLLRTGIPQSILRNARSLPCFCPTRRMPCRRRGGSAPVFRRASVQ